MSTIDSALLARLADGEVHSGADLAADLNCSRTAIWKRLNELRALGLEISAQRGSGYRLERPLELLDAAKIRAGLDNATAAALERFELHLCIPSTNECLRTGAPPAAGRFAMVMAEYQTSGRGRRGRHWVSPLGSGLCLSLNWQFERVPAALPALSLAIGVAVCRALNPNLSAQVGLKWPNDVMAGPGKVGGLLIEVQGEAEGPITVVIGLGINIDVTPEMLTAVKDSGGIQPVGLRALATETALSRNRLAAQLSHELYRALRQFETAGFAPFVEEWRRYDCLAGSPVIVHSGAQDIAGIARGIDGDGALLIEADGQMSRHMAGEVSLRPGTAG